MVQTIYNGYLYNRNTKSPQVKVLQLIDTLEAGGAERMAVNIANTLPDQNVTSFLCATRRAGPLKNEIDNKITFLLLDKKSKLDVRAFRRFFRWIRKEQIEIIHAHSTSILLAVLAKINNRKLKIVWHDHYGMSDAIDYRPSKALKILAKYIDVTIAVNETLADWSKEVLKIKEVYFLRNFATLAQETVRETLLSGIDNKRVVCLANLRPQKNHVQIIKSFKKSIEHYPEWTLHLVGKTFNDEYSEMVKSTITDSNLNGNIFLYGSRNDIKNILEQSTIGVLASVSEGLPISLLEYGNCGLPVIVTNVGQCAEVVGNQGIIIEDVTIELPYALTRLYEKNKNELKLIGSGFRESVQKKYSQEAFTNKLLPIYKALIS